MSPRGTPKIGSHSAEVESEVESQPQAEILGTINPSITDPAPLRPGAMWATDEGVLIDYQEAPPPWEIHGEADDSDARKFVTVPDDWVLRWINPRLLDREGWRGWMAVKQSDSRVTPLVRTMVSVDGYIRRGGSTGDFLAWMPLHWVESRRKGLREKTDKLTASAVDRQAQLREEFAKRGLSVDSVTHPRYTGADGREMRSREV